jgi:hypothetical protein
MSKKQKPVKAPGNFQKLVKAEAMKKRACKGFIAAELDSFRFW